MNYITKNLNEYTLIAPAPDAQTQLQSDQKYNYDTATRLIGDGAVT